MFFLLLIIKHTIYRPTDAAAVSKGELVLKTDITKCSEAGGESWCKTEGGAVLEISLFVLGNLYRGEARTDNGGLLSV